MFANTLTTTDKPILGADVFVFVADERVGNVQSRWGDTWVFTIGDIDIVWALNIFARSFIEQFSRE